MKKILLLSAVMLGAVSASQAGVHFNLGFGLPLPRLPLPPLPGIVVHERARAYCPPTYYSPSYAPAPYCAPADPYCPPASVYVEPREYYGPSVVIEPRVYGGYYGHGYRSYGHDYRSYSYDHRYYGHDRHDSHHDRHDHRR